MLFPFQSFLEHFSASIASMMSDMKIKMAMMMKDTDQSIASIMTDGCNMGIKSLSRYLNQYKNASRESKEIAERLKDFTPKLHPDIKRGFVRNFIDNVTQADEGCDMKYMQYVED